MLPRQTASLPAAPRRRLRQLAALTALLLPVTAVLAAAQTSTTPTPRSLDLPATTATITWTAPATINEEQSLKLGLSGTIDGQATGHVALTDPASACPASPLYPRQLATGTKLTIAPNPAATTPATTTPAATTGDATTPTTTPTPTPAPTQPPTPTSPAPLGGLANQTLSLTPRDAGTFRLCGWVVASPASSETSTVARFDQVVQVASRPATLSAEIPDTVRSGDYFTVKTTGTTASSGRRLLIMAEPDRGQQCAALRKTPTGQRKLQSVVGVSSGAFTKTLRLRFPTKVAGNYLLCIQVVEANDRTPEAIASRTLAVTESLKCVTTQQAIAQRRRDLVVIRGRRDAAQERLTAARQKLTPLRSRYAKAKRASDRRIAAARRAVSRAKSAAGKRSARARLAAVQRRETRRLRPIERPYRKVAATIAVQERTYRQYRTGASLLTDTLARMQRDTKKYCAKPAP